MNQLAIEMNGQDGENVELARSVVPKPPPLDVEKGVPMDMPFGTFTDFIYGLKNGQLIAPDNRLVTRDRLVEMRQKDGTVRALIRLFQLPILRSLREAEWIAPDEIEDEPTTRSKPAAGSKKPSLAQLAADDVASDKDIPEEVAYANHMFTLPRSMGGMSVSNTRFMRQTLLALVEGFSFFEEVRTVPDKGPLKGKIVLQKFAHRDARTIKFVMDDHGGFDGAQQTFVWEGQRKEITYKKDEAWYYAVNEDENPFYGVSMFESAYHHWDIKRKLYYLAHIAAQLAATVARVGSIPRGASPQEITAFQEMLSKFAFNFSGTMPEGYDVNFQTQSTGFNFIPLIDHQNAQIAKSVLAKFIEDEQRQVLIDNGKGDASADFFVMAIESIMEEIAESLTHHMMPRYIDWNFGSDVYPVYRFGVVNDATRDIIKELFIAIATAQTSQWTPEFIRELEVKLVDRLGLEVDYTEVEKREQEDKAKQEQLEQAYFEQKQGGAPGEEQGGGGFGGGGGGAPPGPHPAEIAASVASGGIDINVALSQIETMMLARRESDLDGGT